MFYVPSEEAKILSSNNFSKRLSHILRSSIREELAKSSSRERKKILSLRNSATIDSSVTLTVT